jgi:hypothetical protein
MHRCYPRATQRHTSAIPAPSAHQTIYTDDSVKPEVRAAAANAALAYQRPKISVQAYTNVTSLAQRLDGVQAKVIEHDPAA